MAQGLDRRAVTKDRLATQQGVEPVRLTGPGVRTPNMPVQRESTSKKLLDALGQWAGNTLQAIADKDHAKNEMDGKMAAVQGQTLEQLELDGGDKWALNGHRVITAQTVASAMVAARRQEIEDADYALDTEEFRAKYVEQLGEAVEGQDPRTARMIQEQMMAQMPDLVARHTLANTEYLENQNFEAVKTAIDIQSRDAVGIGNLVNIARGGPDSPSAGLSNKRRTQGVSEGIVLAYTNNNPRAHDLLKIAGVLDNFSTEQLNRVNNARKQWQTRLRTEANQTRLDQEMALDNKIASGELTENEAVAEGIKIAKEHGITLTYNETEVLAKAAVDPNRTLDRARINVMEAATLSQDWPALAAASEPIIRMVESGTLGNEAVGPVIAHGVSTGTTAKSSLQVTDATAAKPGFGIKPSNGTMEDTERVGSELWAVHVARNEGDLELAAIAYHAGHTRVKGFVDAGRDYDALPQPEASRDYWRKFKEARDDMEFPLAGDVFNKSVRDLALAKTAFSLAAYEEAAPRLAELDFLYENGKVLKPDWLEARKAITDTVEGMRDEAMVNYEIQYSKDIVAAAAKEEGKLLKAGQAEILATMMIEPTARFMQVMNRADVSTAAKGKAFNDYRQDRIDILNVLGISMVDSGQAKFIEKAGNALQATVVARQKWLMEEAEIGNAIRTHTVLGLTDPKVRARAYERALKAKANDRLAAWATSDRSQAAEDAKDSGAMTDFADVYSDLGGVDANMRRQESAIALSPMFNEKGEINEEWPRMLSRYQEMVRVNPEVAKGYLTDAARTKVNAVMAIAGGVGNVPDAMSQFSQPRKLPVEVDAFTAQQIVQRKIVNSVAAKKEADDSSGFWHAQELFTSTADIGDWKLTTTSEYARARSDETTDQMTAALEFELGLVYALNPSMDVDLMIETAQQNLNSHSAIIGGSFVNMQGDVMEAFFGDRASQYAKSSIEHQVVLGWLNSDAIKAAHPFIDQQGFAEGLPEHTQDLFSGGLFGMIDPLNRGMSQAEARIAAERGVRPFRAFTNRADQQGLYVQIWLPTGAWSQPIKVDMKAAGLIYMNDHPREDPAG